MLWRVRARLDDRPGALAALAAACGREGVNIKTVQVFPEGASVIDELVLQVPDGWDAARLHTLLDDAGGRTVSTVPVTSEALEDQPTRYVQAVRAVISEPASFPEIAAHLFDADVAQGDGDEDVLEMTVGASATIQIRRKPPFTEIERARAAALAELVGHVLAAHTPPSPTAVSGVEPDYIAEGSTVSAVVGGLVVGRASVSEAAAGEPWPLDLWVDPAWQRRGIGTRLLSELARLARTLGAGEIMLFAPSETQAVLPMVLSAGLRGRIRMAGGQLTVRIGLTDLRP